MAKNVIQKLAKITVVGETAEERDKIKTLFTKIRCKRCITLKGANGVCNLGAVSMSAKKIEYFERDGYHVTVTKKYDHIGKKFLDKRPVDITAKNRKNYDGGAVIAYVCTGKNPDEVQRKQDKFELEMLHLLTQNNLPASRMCVGSDMACVYKHQDCATVFTNIE